MNAVTIQIQIDKENGYSDLPIFTESNLKEISLILNEIEKKLDALKLGFVRCALYLNDKTVDTVKFGV